MPALIQCILSLLAATHLLQLLLEPILPPGSSLPSCSCTDPVPPVYPGYSLFSCSSLVGTHLLHWLPLICCSSCWYPSFPLVPQFPPTPALIPCLLSLLAAAAAPVGTRPPPWFLTTSYSCVCLHTIVPCSPPPPPHSSPPCVSVYLLLCVCLYTVVLALLLLLLLLLCVFTLHSSLLSPLP